MAEAAPVKFIDIDGGRPLYDFPASPMPLPRAGETVTLPDHCWYRVMAVRFIYNEEELARIEIRCQLRDD